MHWLICDPLIHIFEQSSQYFGSGVLFLVIIILRSNTATLLIDNGFA